MDEIQEGLRKIRLQRVKKKKKTTSQVKKKETPKKRNLESEDLKRSIERVTESLEKTVISAEPPKKKMHCITYDEWAAMMGYPSLSAQLDAIDAERKEKWNFLNKS